MCLQTVVTLDSESTILNISFSLSQHLAFNDKTDLYNSETGVNDFIKGHHPIYRKNINPV